MGQNEHLGCSEQIFTIKLKKYVDNIYRSEESNPGAQTQQPHVTDERTIQSIRKPALPLVASWSEVVLMSVCCVFLSSTFMMDLSEKTHYT